MKPLHRLLTILFLIFAVSNQLYSSDLDEFSDNKKLYIDKVNIIGNNILSEKEIFDISEFDNDSYIFINEIRKGILALKESGYFSEVSFLLGQSDKGFTINITVKENPPLASLKVIDTKMLDLGVFKKKLLKYHIVTDMVFSSSNLEKAIEEFNIYNQNMGLFLYIVTYRVVTRNEIMTEGGNFLYEPYELNKNGLHVLVYVRDIPRMVIGEVRMTGVSISFDQILNYLQLKQGVPIQTDAELHYRYKRLKKLGFYDSVYFKLIPQDDIVYRLEIQGKEISQSEISTSLTAPSNIGIIMTAEYYNIAVADTLQRFRFGGGWEIQPKAAIGVIEYTHPYFWKGLFADITLSKYDTADSIKDQDNLKLSENFESKMTTGMNIYGNFFSYIYQKETYAVTKTVDKSYQQLNEFPTKKTVSHSTGLLTVYDNLDDNFFITQGYKITGQFEALWQSPLAYEAETGAEIYIPIPFFNLIAAVNNRSNFLFVENKDKDTTLSLDTRMRTNVQEIQNADVQQIKMTTYLSSELRFPMPENNEWTRDTSFVVFGEAGGAWGTYSAVSLAQTRYGFGVGLRLSPRKHYSSFLFQFPAGIYIGYRTGDTRVKWSLVSHRDSTYYINLTASF